MARDAQKQAKDTYKSAASMGTASGANSTDLYGSLVPQYKQMATNPQGFGAPAIADMTTASNQSLGGSNAAAAGEAAELGASNRNLGSFAPAIAEASRAAGRQQSTNALGIKAGDIGLKQEQKQQGLAGLGGLQDQQNKNVLASLGLRDQSTNTLTEAGKSGWFQNMIAYMNAVSNAGSAASGFPALGGRKSG